MKQLIKPIQFSRSCDRPDNTFDMKDKILINTHLAPTKSIYYLQWIKMPGCDETDPLFNTTIPQNILIKYDDVILTKDGKQLYQKEIKKFKIKRIPKDIIAPTLIGWLIGLLLIKLIPFFESLF